MWSDALTIADREALERFRKNRYKDTYDEVARSNDAHAALRGLLDVLDAAQNRTAAVDASSPLLSRFAPDARAALERLRMLAYDRSDAGHAEWLADKDAALNGLLALLDFDEIEATVQDLPISAELLIGAGFEPQPHPRTGIVNTWSLDVGACDVLVSMPSPGLDEWGVSLVQISKDVLSITRRHWGDVVRLIEALKGGGA